jgi:photosystem II stability/assembly factor-like uncharacterized protein
MNKTKMSVVFLLCSFIFIPGFGQQWEYVNPIPTGNELHNILFTDASTGFICGGAGTILKSVNGGNAWSSRYSSTASPLYCISFSSSMEGFIVGARGTILKTSDGGETWALKSNGGITTTFRYIDFPSTDTGFISTSDGLLLRTTDTGESWNVIYSCPFGELKNITFPTSIRGFAIAGKQFLRSLDGGYTWNVLVNSAYSVNTLCFADDHTGYLSVTEGGGNQCIYKTVDGGITWSIIFYDVANEIDSMFFSDASHGYGSGPGNSVVKTSDGGLSWSTVYYPYPNKPGSMWFFSPNSGFILGGVVNGKPAILQTSTGGTIYSNLVTGRTWGISKIVRLGVTPSWLIAGTDSGKILRTLNYGSTWEVFSTGTNHFIRSIFYAGSQYGWAVGDSGTILYSESYGYSWGPRTSGTTFNLRGMSVASSSVETILITVGDSGTLLKSTGSGYQWTHVNTGVNTNFNSVQLLNTSLGYVVGENGVILKTTDGGSNWTILSQNQFNSLRSVYFTDQNTGYIAGSYVLKTIDAGQTWNILNVPANNYNSVYFRNDGIVGAVVGDSGKVLVTMDSGSTWQNQVSGTNSNLSSVCITATNYAFAVGSWGTILRTNDPDVGISPTPVIAANRIDVFPNPSSDLISFRTGVAEAGSWFSILDNTGREIITGKISGSFTQTDISNLAAGIYILRITKGESSSFGKIIKK